MVASWTALNALEDFVSGVAPRADLEKAWNEWENYIERYGLFAVSDSYFWMADLMRQGKAQPNEEFREECRLFLESVRGKGE